MRRILRAAFFGVVLAMPVVVGSPEQAMRPCPPDLNCNGSVNMDDLLAVVNNWGQTGPTFADLNESGLVDIDDLLAVVNGWGPCLFDYGAAQPNAEAQQIGLEMLGPNGPLTLSQPVYQRIVRDLGLIRNAVPGLINQSHSMAWSPNQLIVGLQITPAHPSYECLNVFYQVTDRQLLFTAGNVQYWVITFAGNVNVPALANVYDLLGDVVSAEPNGVIGGQNFYRPTDLGDGTWLWDIDDGFHDCFDGCDCHRLYLIETDAEAGVKVLSSSQQGQPWCEWDMAEELALWMRGAAVRTVKYLTH
jgi:hypothetical protein